MYMEHHKYEDDYIEEIDIDNNIDSNKDNLKYMYERIFYDSYEDYDENDSILNYGIFELKLNIKIANHDDEIIITISGDIDYVDSSPKIFNDFTHKYRIKTIPDLKEVKNFIKNSTCLPDQYDKSDCDFINIISNFITQTINLIHNGLV